MVRLEGTRRDATMIRSTNRASEPAMEASISAAERRIADGNERIILDLIRGRDTSAEEERVARDLLSLARMRGRRTCGSRTAR
jgi:hypothetical protein